MKKPRSPGFLCCFGIPRKQKFPGKISSSVKVVESSNCNRKQTTCLCSWSVFRMKNSSSKTVPLDTSDKSADLSEIKIRSLNSKSKWKIPKLFTKRTNYSTTKATPFREVPVFVKEIIEETTQGPEQNNTVENRKSLDHRADNTSKDATCRKRSSFCRKIDAIRTGSNQPGSKVVVTKPNPKSATLSHKDSVSIMPVPIHEKRANPLPKSRIVPKKTRQHDDNVTVNKFDPVVGLSIIVVTLIIMLIWGRLCAVLCTSAWLYFAPRLRALKKDDAVVKINGDLDLNSEEYKRRVVLEGFLDRDHRAAVKAVL